MTGESRLEVTCKFELQVERHYFSHEAIRLGKAAEGHSLAS